MAKYDDFLLLAKDVSCCHLCQQLSTLPHSNHGEYLENDDHGLTTDMPYVNLWNLWHGNLDADIMVIGQDFGQKEDADAFVELQKSKNYTNPTDKALRELFKSAFNIDVDSPNESLFFTNTANCYRKQRTSGGTHSAWLPICAHKFMLRLIRIVQPKIIIVLGRAAFEALHCMENVPIVCSDPIEKGKDSFSEMISYRYELDLDGTKIGVFPVYHPGANSQMNRSGQQQVEDWKKIKECYDKVK